MKTTASYAELKGTSYGTKNTENLPHNTKLSNFVKYSVRHTIINISKEIRKSH